MKSIPQVCPYGPTGACFGKMLTMIIWPVLTNEPDNTKRIEEEKNIEKAPKFLKNIWLSIRTTSIGLFQALTKQYGFIAKLQKWNG